VGGSTIDCVTRTKGVRFQHAVEMVHADHPSLATGDARVVEKGTTPKLPTPPRRGWRRNAAVLVRAPQSLRVVMSLIWNRRETIPAEKRSRWPG
jgi:hypothetical protein